MRKLTYRDAVNEALREEMRRDERVFLIGEDIGTNGNVFKVLRGLIDEFGMDRVIDTPISETAIIGAALGAAATGMRPVPEIMFADFLCCAMDQIMNQVAKMRYMSGGQAMLPITIRTQNGAGMGAAAQHSQSLTALFMHVPGLLIVTPSTPCDAKGLLKTSIREDNPVLFFEHKSLYNVEGEVPEGDFTIPLGEAEVKRKGKDVTVVAVSFMVHKALAAAAELAKEGIEAEVVDPRTLVPFDKERLFASLEKTGKLVIVDEDCKRNGVGAEIAAVVAEEAFDLLDAPPKRVSTPNTPIPCSSVLEKHVIPDESDVVRAVRELCA
ncbi:MAG: alpha-ketoacid dehydrogenase subunit beta [Planctomycetota bacterium]